MTGERIFPSSLSGSAGRLPSPTVAAQDRLLREVSRSAVSSPAAPPVTAALLVALLKNAELRADHAIQSKLDALATGMLEAIRDEGDDAGGMLQRAIRIDEQV